MPAARSQSPSVSASRRASAKSPDASASAARACRTRWAGTVAWEKSGRRPSSSIRSAASARSPRSIAHSAPNRAASARSPSVNGPGSVSASVSRMAAQAASQRTRSPIRHHSTISTTLTNAKSSGDPLGSSVVRARSSSRRASSIPSARITACRALPQASTSSSEPVSSSPPCRAREAISSTRSRRLRLRERQPHDRRQHGAFLRRVAGEIGEPPQPLAPAFVLAAPVGGDDRQPRVEQQQRVAVAVLAEPVDLGAQLARGRVRTVERQRRGGDRGDQRRPLARVGRLAQRGAQALARRRMRAGAQQRQPQVGGQAACRPARG